MPTSSDLRPATIDEIGEALAFALCYDGRKRVHHADALMARITTERIIQHLERCGFVVLKRPDLGAPSASHHGSAPTRKPGEP